MSGETVATEGGYKVLVQRVLSYHNNKYRTNIVILGRYEDIYPGLRGKANWDWVCRDETKGNEVAVEVKRLTNPELEERSSVLDEIGRQLSSELSGKLPGTFLLDIGIPEEPIEMRLAHKEQLKGILKESICEAAQRLRMKGEEDLTQCIQDKLPHQLSEKCTFSISKHNSVRSYLGISPHYIGFGPIERLEGKEFKEFKELIQGANRQLGLATKRGISETILILIEQGFSFAEADVIQETFRVLELLDYNHIKHVYRISGDEVQEIFPSSAARDNEINKDGPHLSRMVMEFTLPSEPPDTD